MAIHPVHISGHDPKWNMPYTAGLKVTGGSLLFVSGVTAAPVYHSHPHVTAEFDDLPDDPATQAELAMDNLAAVLDAGGTSISGLVQLMRFIVDADKNQDDINRVMGARLGSHRPTTTTVEVVRLATDPRLVLELQAIAAVD
jgi:enamine deaminase RidA (YjgF/YER057c/UK114 family)